MKRILCRMMALVMLAALYPFMHATIVIAAEQNEWSEVTMVSAGSYHTVVIRADGSLWAWGENDHGQLGDDTKISKNSPLRIGKDNDWKSVTAGVYHTVALKTDGSLWAWGKNSDGQLGDGSSYSRKTPVQIGTDTDWKSVAAGGYHTIALKTDGSLWAWGDNVNGQLGDGTKTSRYTPVQIGTDTDWKSVYAGWFHTLAIKADGSLWTWGDNEYGQLGNGISGANEDNVPYNSCVPVQIGTDTDWASAALGDWHTAALKTDGSLWTWGDNTYGQLGNSPKEDVYEPTQVGTDTNWTSVKSGAEHIAALKADGSLWTWGDNCSGQLGNGTIVDEFEPVRVGVDNDWKSIEAAEYQTMAIKSDGSLWAWGENTFGQLGDGSDDERRTPTLILGPPIPVAGVAVNKTAVEIEVDRDVKLTPVFTPSHATNQNVTWASSDDTIATVSQSGEITAISPGTATITLTTEDGGFTASCEVTVIKNTHGIDYEGVTDIIVLGSVDGFSINLTQETITIPASYTSISYSIDGGSKWKDVRDALSTAKFPKLFNKDMTLQLSDKPIDRKTKQPEEGAVIVSFAQINKRPSAPKVVVNYAIGADSTGKTTGDWVLTERNGTTALKDGIQISAADTNNKYLDGNGFGHFFPGASNGILIKSLVGDKVKRTSYFIRIAPNFDGATYTAASKPKKITVYGEQKAPKYKYNTKYDNIKLKKGDYIFAGAPEDVGELPVVTDMSYVDLTKESVLLISGSKGSTVNIGDMTGILTIWKAATAKKPASAKQTIEVK